MLNNYFKLAVSITIILSTINYPVGILKMKDNENNNQGCIYASVDAEREVYYDEELDLDYMLTTSEDIPKNREITIGGVVTAVLTVQGVCHWMGDDLGFNPCHWLIGKLATEVPEKRAGKYKITKTYIPGRVPGCEPINSGPCNQGYWKIDYTKIG